MSLGKRFAVCVVLILQLFCSPILEARQAGGGNTSGNTSGGTSGNTLGGGADDGKCVYGDTSTDEIAGVVCPCGWDPNSQGPSGGSGNKYGGFSFGTNGSRSLPPTGNTPGGGNPGCSSCGGSGVAAGAPDTRQQMLRADQVYRIWYPTERTTHSSFSPGYFGHYDSKLMLYPETGGVSVDYLNVVRQNSYTFVDGLDGDTRDGEFHDLVHESAVKIEMLNSSGTKVTDPANAETLELTHRSGLVETFELIDLDSSPTEEDWAARLTKRTSVIGRELTVSYKSWTQAEIDASPARQWQIDEVTDDFSNTLTFTYDTTQHGGRWCVTKIARNDGPDVDFQYTGDELTKVTFQDGGETTYAYSQNTADDTTVVTSTEVMSSSMNGIFELANDFTSGTPDPPTVGYAVPGRAMLKKNHDDELAWKHVLPVDPADDMVMIIREGKADVAYGDRTTQKVTSYTPQGAPGGGVSMDLRTLPSPFVAAFGGVSVSNLSQDWRGSPFFLVASLFQPGGGSDFEGYSTVTLDTTVYGVTATQTQIDTATIPTFVDEAGRQYDYTYDADNNTTKITFDADNTFKEFSYNTFGQTTRERSREGWVVLNTYDSDGNLTSRKEGYEDNGTTDVQTADYREWTYEYYGSSHANAGLLKKEKDPLYSSSSPTLHCTDYEYNSADQVTKITGPADSTSSSRPVTTYTYNSNGLLASMTDPESHVTLYSYDTMGRLTKTTYPDTSTEQTLYGTGSEKSLVVKTKDRADVVTYYDYDSSGRMIETKVGAAIDADILDGNADDTVVTDVNAMTVTEYEYVDGSSSLKSKVTSNGAVTDYVYDNFNRLEEVKQYPRSGKTLTSTKVYESKQLLYDEDPYGRRKYYGYRASDGTLIRTVTCTNPSYSLTNFAAVWALTRDTSANADFIVHDAIRDDDGNLTKIIDGRNIETRYEYDSLGRETKKTEAFGTSIAAVTETDYDDAGNVTEVRMPRYFDSGDTEGYQKAKDNWTYNGRNQVLTHTAATGSSVAATESYTYDLGGHQATHTDFEGNVWETIEDSCCNLSSASKNPLGHGSIRNSDPMGRVVHTATVSDVSSHTNNMLNPVDAKTLAETTTAYDALGRSKAMTRWLVKRSAISRDDPPIAGYGSVSKSDGLTTQYLYDNNLSDGVGLDASGGVSYTKMAASGSGSVSLSNALTKLASTQANGGAGISFSSTAPGRASVVINGEDEVSFSISDASGRTVMSGRLDNYSGTQNALLTWSCQLHDTVTSVSGFGNCLETRSIDALGKATKSFTDGAGRTLQTIDQLSKVTSFTYDAAGNQLSIRDPNNVGQDVVYDQLGRAGLTTDTASDTTNSAYDKAGNRISATDGKSNTTTYVYDARGRQKSQTDRNGETTSFTYLDTGQLASLTDAESQTTSYTYDDAGNKLTEQYPDHTGGSPGASTYGIVTFTNDDAGRMLRKQDQKGDTVTYNYDLAGRLTSRDYRTKVNSPSGTIADTDSFTYDAAGRMLTAISGRYVNTVAYTYDTAGRKSTEALTISGRTYTTTTDYDSKGQLTAIAYPDGTAVDRSYTDRGELYQLKYAGTTIDTRTYDNGGRMTASNYNNGVNESRSYNTDNTLASISYTGASIGTLSYGWDDNKNKTSEGITGTMSGYGFSIPSSGYDDEDRLVSYNRTDGNLDQSWSLSEVGDWDSVTTEGTTQSRTHGPAHELLTGGGGTVNSDVKGNITLIPSQLRPNSSSLLMNWDMDNRLSTADVGNDSSADVTYKFDALGRRVYRDDGTTAMVYVQSGQQTISDYVAGTVAASPTYNYVYASYIDEPAMRDEPGAAEKLYYHRNQQYSITALTNASGTIVERYAYSAYGVPTITNASGTLRSVSSYDNRYTFTGREWDDKILMYHYRARMYDANLGRFCSKDPIGYADTMSTYSFVGNSPLLFLDPSGNLKIYDVDDSPKCVVGSVLPGGTDTNQGAYWGIMVELSEQEKNLMLKSGGGYLIFTVDWKYNEWNCSGDEKFSIDKTYWIATAIVIHNGEVKMHHTNDNQSELQYLQIVNYTLAAAECGNKDKDVRKVTVELVPKDLASKLLHMDRLPNVPHVPSPEGPGSVNDEVGVDATGRPWRKGADRSKLSRATATSTIEFNYCVDPATCRATSSGTSGSKSRPRTSTVIPVNGDDYPWPHTR